MDLKMEEEKMKNTICVDVDGVLAQYDGWKGVEHIGNPLPGAVEFTEMLSKYFNVIIHTTRVNAEINISHTEEELKEILIDWLNLHGFKYSDIRAKPMAVAYVDDCAIVCTPQASVKTWDWYRAAWSELRMKDSSLPAWVDLAEKKPIADVIIVDEAASKTFFVSSKELADD